MRHDESIETASSHGPPAVGAGQPLAPLALEPEAYLEDLNGFDLTEEQQRELLQTLWYIMSVFVDIGWGVDTVQILLPELFGEATETHCIEKGDNHD